tara:strand:+ start:4780 stop:5877 length:1098 start_codon:yes stop_codon:yes gene_type:complete
MSKIDSNYKQSLRWAWRAIQTVISFLPKSRNGISVWYGGARAGDIGGPLVKVKRLKEHFPEQRYRHSIVYTLSNTPYLTKLAFKSLKSKNIPIVLNQNGVFYGAWFDGDWQEKNKEMSIAWINADHVFCQSEFCLRCAETFLGNRTGETEILYNAIDLEHFSPVTSVSQDREPTFLVTGKFDSHMFYRIEASLRGFEIVRNSGLNAKIVIAGWMSNDCLKKCNQLIDALGVEEHTSLLGSYTQENAPDIYRSADVYLMLKHNDPCPNTVLESLGCGLPVLYSNSGGVPELAPGLSGHPLEVDQSFEKTYTPSPEVIAMGMEAILQNLPERKIAARRRAKEAFDINKWVHRHRKVFDTLLAKNRTR